MHRRRRRGGGGYRGPRPDMQGGQGMSGGESSDDSAPPSGPAGE
jgi:hypothetical protein